ncbi:CKLF-like MARVEL transmembrane domain-containing protein 7 isoform X2 [Pangasianodon hypophthalmus]|uniref:CKLF-like MARVEL transmembrane domain-containing protein 7 isoform X2 n=1 Tax=Pangasianodon hypophthalmus TaxID=310915 RepID=UPI0023079351|nr:CKLF-like MARVEL transmembrane domain-containing protein 7 isoform X2 [Pangasianodon hypophthalmus]
MTLTPWRRCYEKSLPVSTRVVVLQHTLVKVTLMIAFLCVHCAPRWTDYDAFRYFEVVTLWFLFAFLIFFLMYVFRLQSKLPCINWTLTVIFSLHLGHHPGLHRLHRSSSEELQRLCSHSWICFWLYCDFSSCGQFMDVVQRHVRLSANQYRCVTGPNPKLQEGINLISYCIECLKCAESSALS